MREIRKWVAKDGTEFAFREACELYEWEQRFADVKNDLCFFDKDLSPCGYYDAAHYVIIKSQEARKALEKYCKTTYSATPWDFRLDGDTFFEDEVICWIWYEEHEIWVSLNHVQEECKKLHELCGKLITLSN